MCPSTELKRKESVKIQSENTQTPAILCLQPCQNRTKVHKTNRSDLTPFPLQVTDECKAVTLRHQLTRRKKTLSFAATVAKVRKFRPRTDNFEHRRTAGSGESR
jgi:hypothetical protein